jgi:hypothetical protein
MNLGKGFETSIKMNYTVDNPEDNSENSHHRNLKTMVHNYFIKISVIGFPMLIYEFNCCVFYFMNENELSLSNLSWR